MIGVGGGIIISPALTLLGCTYITIHSDDYFIGRLNHSYNTRKSGISSSSPLIGGRIWWSSDRLKIIYEIERTKIETNTRIYICWGCTQINPRFLSIHMITKSKITLT